MYFLHQYTNKFYNICSFSFQSNIYPSSHKLFTTAVNLMRRDKTDSYIEKRHD
jgi:hypothetical protein